MMKKNIVAIALMTFGLSNLAHADDAALRSTLKKIGLSNPEIQAAPIAGLKSVLTPHGVLYVSDDGKYVLQGPMFDVSGDKPVNLSNQPLLAKLNALQNEMIIYKAAKEKHVVTVFTDITCGYCHKLHQQIKEYNDLGITVRYLAFPRAGLDSQPEKDMQSIWCSADRKKALDAAMRGDDIAAVKSPAMCKTDIAAHFMLGQQFGVTGTPAVVLEDGTLVSGYQPPKDMAAMLDAQLPASGAAKP
jgi:thiol:disulfide interchange protein DsbC